MQSLGLDIGGSGIKGAIVDTAKGEPVTDRFRIETPEGAKPRDVMDAIRQVVNHFEWKGPVGCGFPAAVRRGTILTAANIDKSWIGLNLEQLLREELGQPAAVLNDADAAGEAEMQRGAGVGERGTVFVITLGTGIGTALFSEGVLVANTELGHVIIDGKDIETVASEAAKKREDLSNSQWGKRLSSYFRELDRLFWPDLYIIGGGGGKKFDKFAPHLNTPTRMVAAKLGNMAGIVGAACVAARSQKPAVKAAR